MAATARIPVLMTPTEKRALQDKAKKAGISMAEFMRRAAAGYQPGKDEAALEAMIGEMNKATTSAERAIDDALAYVAESNARIEALEQRSKPKAA